MHLNRLFSWVFVLILVLSPVLAGCQNSTPTVATPPASAGSQSAPATAATGSSAVAQSAATKAPIAVPTRAPLPPLILRVTPEPGQEQRLDAPIVVQFDQAMDPASTQKAFQIEPSIAGDVVVEGDHLTFTPSSALERGAQYQITLDENAASAGGLKLAHPVTFKFATVGYLEVTNTQPARGTEGVPTDTKITVSFNRPVVPLSGGEQTALPIPLVFTPTVEGSGVWLNTGIYQFTPKNGLAASTGYSVTVQAGLPDTTGGVLDADYTFDFRTADPSVASWAPDSVTNLPVEQGITVTFSLPMEHASTEAAFSLTDQQKNRVEGVFSWNQDDTAMGFKPRQRLQFGADYIASVTEAARPANGQGNLRGGDTRTYKTVKAPTIIRTEPAQGARTADPFGGVTIQFASPVVATQFTTGTFTIVPKPTTVYTNYNAWENVLFIGFDRLPATAYTVTLSGNTVDRYGNKLGKDHVLRFTTRDYDPSLQLNSAGQVGTFNAYTPTQAIVTYRNVPEILFQVSEVPVQDFIALTGRNYWEVWDKYNPQPKNLVREWRETTRARRNQSGLLKFNLTDDDGEQLPPGMYFLQIMGSGLRANENVANSRQLVARTSLNVTMKTQQDGALAWVTDLKSGQPAAGVTVRFVDNGMIDLEATTDKDGIARVQFPPTEGVPSEKVHHSWDPLLAIASGDAGQFGVVLSSWEDGIGAWNFDLPGGGYAQPYNAYVFTDRPIYRPGQTVYWKAVVRRDQDAIYSLPAPGLPVTATIMDDQGNEVLRQQMELDGLGTVNGKFTLGADAMLGYYNLNLILGVRGTPEQETLSYGLGFQVAEYRKPEYEISAQTDRADYVQGDQVRVTVQADYFFGGAVKNAKVIWTLLANDYGFEYKGKGNYSWTDWDWYERSRGSLYSGVQAQGEGKTDAQGRFSVSVPADIAKFAQSQRFNFDITIQDVNNQAVSTQASAVVHKGDFYIGLHPQSYVSTVGEANGVDVLTVDPQSQPVANTSVQLVFNQVEWFSVSEKLDDGRFYWNTKAKVTPVFTTTVTTGSTGTATTAWTPSVGGEYKVVATGRDRAGHVIRSAAYLWVSQTKYTSWRQENNDRIQLVADKDQYSVGDTAEILVASPYQTPVKALLSIERSGIISHRVIEVTGNSEVLRVPITPEFAPDVFVSLVMVKGMDTTNPAPTFRVGLAQLRVSVADKQLQVLLTPAGINAQTTPTGTLRVGPRDTVTWTVTTLDAAGKPVAADVSLALIDKAILTLASDNAGSLMDRFHSQRALGVRTAATLVVNIDRIVAQLARGGKGGGGGGGGSGNILAVRSDFPDVAFWQANVSTGANGKAQVAVKLPDNLTTWTMDARAATSDTLVGQARAEIIATKELLVRPVLPRFLVEGDEAEIAAVIHNNTQQSLEATVDYALTGIAPRDAVGDGPAPRVTIAAGANHKIVLPIKTNAGAEQAIVRWSVKGGGLSDSVEITLPVHRYTTPDVVGTSGQVADGEGRLELIRLPEDADPTRGELDVRLEPSLAAGMVGGLDYLQHFPYECVEQTMSRFLPNVVSYAALKKLGIAQPELETRLPQEVGVGLQRLYARQHVDGGWGWWQADQSNPTVTAYVIFGLGKAKSAGFAVDENVLGRATRYLSRQLKAVAGLSQWETNQQAFMVYALAAAGQVEPNRAGALFEARERLSLYAKGYLALALALINDDAAPARIQTLLADINGKAVTSATGAHWEEGWTDYRNMNTDTRTTAIIVDVLAQLDPKNSLAPNAVRWLMSARQAARWETTQENAWAIIGLTDWMAATGELQGNYSWQVLLNDQSLGSGNVTPATVGEVTDLQAGVAQLLLDQTNGLVIRRTTESGQTGAGQLYYTAHLKTYLPVDKVEPLDRGVVVSREYRLADCVNPALPANTSATATQPTRAEMEQKCDVITGAKVGDVIDVKLNIIVPNTLHYLVVEDPLPAGTEAVDTSLRTTSARAEGPGMRKETQGEGEKQAPVWDWWWTPTHFDLRDEKVALFATTLEPGSYAFTYQVRASLPGRYLTLPPTAYEMYFPEVWGRGAGSVFTVTE